MENLLTLKEVLLEMTGNRSEEYKARLNFFSAAANAGLSCNYTYDGIIGECDSKANDPDHLYNLNVWDWCGSDIYIVIHNQQINDVITVSIKEELESNEEDTQ